MAPIIKDWRTDLVGRYPDLFNVGHHGHTYTPGYPECGAGSARARWAVVQADGGSFRPSQIKEKFGTLPVRHACPKCGSDNVQFVLSIEELADDDPLIAA